MSNRCRIAGLTATCYTFITFLLFFCAQITSFTRELQEFKHGTSEFQTIVGGVGTNEEKAALRKSVNNCIKTLKGFQECQKVIIAALL